MRWGGAEADAIIAAKASIFYVEKVAGSVAVGAINAFPAQISGKDFETRTVE
jgi:hypothetical protein